MMRLKPGVRIAGLSPEILVALVIADGVYALHGEECVVSSVVDSKHSSPSLHYTGHAVDLRFPSLNNRQAIFAELKARLGADFDVVLEKDHIHIEFQPKTGVNLAL